MTLNEVDNYGDQLVCSRCGVEKNNDASYGPQTPESAIYEPAGPLPRSELPPEKVESAPSLCSSCGNGEFVYQEDEHALGY